MADNPQLENFRQGLDDVSASVRSLNDQLNDTIRRRLVDAVAEAQKLGDVFSKNKDISKDAAKQLFNLNKQNEILALKEENRRKQLAKALRSNNQAKQDQLATELQQIIAERKINEQIDAQIRNLQKTNEERKKQNSLSEAFKQASEKVLGDQIKSVKQLTTLTGLMVFLVEAAFKADKQTTELAKSLVITKEQARDVRYEFVEYSRSLNDAFITTNKLIEANAKLGEQLGLAKIFSMDLNKEFVNITQKVGVSEEAAGGLFKNIVASGRGARQVLSATVGIVEKVKQETGLRLNNRKILEATGKVAGQLLANFKASPEAIAEAIAKTQTLGTTIEQTAAQGKTLLDFESSIDNELKAELLTGRELNLERARAAALMGDQKTVAEELSAQAMDFNEFSKLNVIQQEALAKSLGLSADALSEQLFKQQYLNKSREEILAIGGEEALQRMEALSAQDKFNAAVEKLQDLLGNILAGPLGGLIDGFASILSNTVAISALMGGALVANLMKAVRAQQAMTAATRGEAIGQIVAKSWASLGGWPVVGPALAGAAIAGGIAYLSTQSSKATAVEDAFIPSSGPVIKTKAGTFQGRPDDNVMLGTNISPSRGGNGSLIAAIGQMTSAMQNMTNQRSNINIDMDGRKVGTGTYGASTKFR